MARKGKPSRRQRNQAKWDAHAASHTSATISTAPTTKPAVKVDSDKPTVPSYAGGTKPRLVTGSMTGAPHKVTVTQRKGVSLRPFSDYIPKTPSDYATLGDEKEWLDSEKAGRYVRMGREATEHMANSVTGGEGFQSYKERLPQDVAAGVYRDGAGRIMRLTTTPDASFVVRTREHTSTNERGITTTVKVEEMVVVSGDRRPEGVPAIIMREEAGNIRARARRDAADAKREEKRLIREQKAADAAQRRLDRMTGKNSVDRAEMTAAARAVCAAHGIKNPTPVQISAARDMIAHQRQVAEYTTAA